MWKGTTFKIGVNRTIDETISEVENSAANNSKQRKEQSWNGAIILSVKKERGRKTEIVKVIEIIWIFEINIIIEKNEKEIFIKIREIFRISGMIAKWK